MKDFYVELKICEGCGGLWLRARELEASKRGAYCSGCVRWLAEFPEQKRAQGQVRGESQRKRRRRNRAVRANGVGAGVVVEVKANELELTGVGGGR
jgi:hypothetical protein